MWTCKKIFAFSDASSHNFSHDEIAKFLEVPAMPFDVMFPDKAKEMKRMMLDYIKILRRAHAEGYQDAGEEIMNGIQRNTLQIDETGFPKAPRPISWLSVTRAELEPIYRLYITKQYRE
jgi:hypothetical protein